MFGALMGALQREAVRPGGPGFVASKLALCLAIVALRTENGEGEVTGVFGVVWLAT
jgi:hypothetical protein